MVRAPQRRNRIPSETGTTPSYSSALSGTSIRVPVCALEVAKISPRHDGFTFPPVELTEVQAQWGQVDRLPPLPHERHHPTCSSTTQIASSTASSDKIVAMDMTNVLIFLWSMAFVIIIESSGVDVIWLVPTVVLRAYTIVFALWLLTTVMPVTATDHVNNTASTASTPLSSELVERPFDVTSAPDMSQLGEVPRVQSVLITQPKLVPTCPNDAAPQPEQPVLLGASQPKGLVSKRQACLLRDVLKRLTHAIEATSQEVSPADAILVFTNMYHALVAAMGTRDGHVEVLAFLGPVAQVVKEAKRLVRQKGGKVVKLGMQETIVMVLIEHTAACVEIIKPVVGSSEAHWPEVPSNTKLTEKTLSAMSLIDKAPCRLATSFTSNTSSSTSPPSPASSSLSSTASWTSSFSTASIENNKERKGRFSPYNSREQRFKPRNAAVSPGAAFVPLRRATVRVNPRGTSLCGAGVVYR